MTIFGYVRDAEFASHARAERGQVFSGSENLAADVRRIDETRERFDQFRLAVAFDARNADDLAGANFEGNVVDSARARTRGDRKISDFQRGAADRSEDHTSE